MTILLLIPNLDKNGKPTMSLFIPGDLTGGGATAPTRKHNFPLPGLRRHGAKRLVWPTRQADSAVPTGRRKLVSGCWSSQSESGRPPVWAAALECLHQGRATSGLLAFGSKPMLVCSLVCGFLKDPQPCVSGHCVRISTRTCPI